MAFITDTELSTTRALCKYTEFRVLQLLMTVPVHSISIGHVPVLLFCSKKKAQKESADLLQHAQKESMVQSQVPSMSQSGVVWQIMENTDGIEQYACKRRINTFDQK